MAEADPVSLRAALLELPRDVAAQLIADVLGAMMAKGAPCPKDVRALLLAIANQAAVYAYRPGKPPPALALPETKYARRRL